MQEVSSGSGLNTEVGYSIVKPRTGAQTWSAWEGGDESWLLSAWRGMYVQVLGTSYCISIFINNRCQAKNGKLSTLLTRPNFLAIYKVDCIHTHTHKHVYIYILLYIYICFKHANTPTTTMSVTSTHWWHSFSQQDTSQKLRRICLGNMRECQSRR